MDNIKTAVPGHDTTLASRWKLEPLYPQVAAHDAAHCEAIANWLSLGPSVQTTLGIKVELGPRISSYIAYLVVNDAYEHGDIALIRRYVRTGKKSLVLGAGMGVIATALAQQTDQPVVVVDANQDVCDFVASTALLNEVQLDFIHGAIVPGRCSGTVDFTVSEEFWASSLRQDTYKAEKTVRALIISVDALLTTHTPSVLFVDIEGAKVGLFPNSMWIGIQQLFVEIHRPNIGGEAWASVIADIHALGFKMVDSSGLTCYFEREETKN